MMGVKGGTQTWTTAPQQSSLKPEPGQALSADEREKVLGDKDLGEYLNKVADPNWVDPAKTRKVGNNELGKDAFLKLLLAQMKNQDPTNPLKSHEMSAQLAQFTSLEKLTNIDTGIEKLSQRENPVENYQLLNLMGKTIQSDSSKVLRLNKTESHDLSFTIPRDAERAKITIRNANGEMVREHLMHNAKVGENSFSWNGADENGEVMAEGEYNVQIEAWDSFGKKMYAETKYAGTVTGVNFTAQGPVLVVGNKSVRLRDVKSFAMPGQGGAAAQPVATGDLPPIGSLPANPGQKLSGVAMSRGLLNKVTQETLSDSQREIKK